MRLDAALVASGKAPGRERAKEWIKNGLVLKNGKVCTKPSEPVESTDTLEVQLESYFVSRGGEKLEAAMEHFHPDVKNAACVDIGASTGGFTECLLRHGASKVYAVDVGEGQLAQSLQTDPRVVNMEKTNARYLSAADFPEPVDFLTCDASFISLSLLFPAFAKILPLGKTLLCLVKPQFEAGKAALNKKGVVTSKEVHAKVLTKVIAQAAEHGLQPRGLASSPVLGPNGNREFLLLLQHTGETEAPDMQDEITLIAERNSLC